MEVRISQDWKTFLNPLFEREEFHSVANKLRDLRAKGQEFYPRGGNIFAAFDHSRLNELKVVILGQDPYHGPNQANGLSFSVNRGIATPPSLRNIYQELSTDLGCTIPPHGDLTKWAKQGVLMLNAVLTVFPNKPASHQDLGWQWFTDGVIRKLSAEKENLVFILWGSYAKRKEELIDHNRHLILKSTHPSPFSARNGFFGCKHFSKANAYLVAHQKEAVDWQID